MIVSKICDRSVNIKNNKNSIVLFKDKCLGFALLLPFHIIWYTFFFSLIIVEVNGSNDDELRQTESMSFIYACCQLKKHIQQGMSNPIFYGDLVYTFKKIIGRLNFPDLFKRIVNRFRRAGYTFVVNLRYCKRII